MKLKGTRKDYHEDAKGRETTRDERVKIIALRDHSKPQMSWSAIGKEMQLDRGTCQKIYRRAKLIGTPSNRKRSGRPPLFDDEEKEHLRQFVTQDRDTRRLSWKEIRDAMGYSCTPEHVRDIMASMGLTVLSLVKPFSIPEGEQCYLSEEQTRSKSAVFLQVLQWVYFKAKYRQCLAATARVLR